MNYHIYLSSKSLKIHASMFQVDSVSVHVRQGRKARWSSSIVEWRSRLSHREPRNTPEHRRTQFGVRCCTELSWLGKCKQNWGKVITASSRTSIYLCDHNYYVEQNVGHEFPFPSVPPHWFSIHFGSRPLNHRVIDHGNEWNHRSRVFHSIPKVTRGWVYSPKRSWRKRNTFI
jgi:hypothetical protein